MGVFGVSSRGAGRLCAGSLALALASCGPRGDEPVVARIEPSLLLASERHANREDTSGRGAVWCAWGIYVEMYDVGRQCFGGERIQYQFDLVREIRRIDRFILANSSTPVDQAQLDSAKARLRRPYEQTCTAETVAMYRRLERTGGAALTAEVDDLLSIPREPLFNPCL